MRTLALIPLALCAAAAVHAAHAAAPTLTMTDPEANSVVKAPVYMVHLMFDLPININTAMFNITDRNGKPVEAAEPMRGDDEGKMLMAIPNKPLAPGIYHVKWHATGPDGKPLDGEFSFTAQ